MGHILHGRIIVSVRKRLQLPIRHAQRFFLRDEQRMIGKFTLISLTRLGEVGFAPEPKSGRSPESGHVDNHDRDSAC